MKIDIAFFFEGIKSTETPGARVTVPGNPPVDLLRDKEALELVRSYYAIPENQRRHLFDLARVLSKVA